jgi:hypothetical protein
MVEDNQENKYLVTDAIAKGIFIDGMVGLAIFAIPYVTPNLVSPTIFPALSRENMVLQFTKSTIIASMAYYIRDNFRDAGYELLGGAIGHTAKYVAKLDRPEALLVEAGAGAVNGVLYEACTNEKSCMEESPMNLMFPMFAESFNLAVVGGAIKGVSLSEKLFAGGTAGLIGSLSVNYLYVPIIPHIHEVVDCIYAEGHMDPMKAGECSLHKVASVFDFLYEYVN